MSIKQRVIEEASNLFVHYGIKSVRMDDLASTLGVSKRTIYEIFGDKDNLILECVRHFHKLAEERNRQINANATNIIEEFICSMDNWDRQADDNYKIMTSIKKFHPKVYEKLLQEYRREGYVNLKKKLEDGVRDGYLLDNIDLNLAISVFTYSVYGIIKEDSLLPHNVTEREAFKYVITYFFRGIATEKGIRMIDEHITKKKREA